MIVYNERTGLFENRTTSTASPRPSTQNRVNTGPYWFFIILFLAAAVVGFVLYFDAYNEAEYYENQYYSEQNNVSSSKDKISKLESQLSEKKEELRQVRNELSTLKSSVKSVAPLVITNVEIGNTYKNGEIETDFGSNIYSYRTMYLMPKIYYRCFSSGTYNLKTKWFRPDGTMATGSGSPSGYSQEYDYSLSEGTNDRKMSGYGNETKGHWNYGNYRLEIWYNGRCLYVKNFYVYS